MKGWQRRLVDASAIVALLGLVFVLGGVTLWYLVIAPTTASLSRTLFELVMHVLFGGIILALGVHIERSELMPEEQFAVVVWCYGGFTLMFALSVWGHLDTILAGELTIAFASDFVVFTSIGGAFGVIAGVNWGRSTKNRLLAERNEEQRETLALLTRLLSHDIKNDMGIIKGYVDFLGDQVSEDAEGYVEVIEERVDGTVQLLDDASTLVQSLDTERDFERVDLSGALRRQTRTIEENHPEVTVETDIPDGITVEADSLIHQLFSNLLQNAVFHNDPEELTVRVSAEQTADGTEVVVSDDGTGIPPEVRETCFELGKQGPDSDGDGIGLYLVSRLANVYGGSVEVDESPEGGARFRISLPNPSDTERPAEEPVPR